jgi:hypothetical protein
MSEAFPCLIVRVMSPEVRLERSQTNQLHSRGFSSSKKDIVMIESVEKMSWLSLIPVFVAFVAFLTNPSRGDFDAYMDREYGMLSLNDYQLSNYYVFSIYKVHSLSFRRGEDKRVVLGIFDNFVELNQSSNW